MRQTIYILLLFAIFANTGQAKTAYYSGKIIQNDDKIISGKIEVVSPIHNELKVNFIHPDQKKQTFTVKDIKGYYFDVSVYCKESRKYKTHTISYERKVTEDPVVPMGSKEIFVERIVEGSVNIYNHYSELSGQVKLNHFFYVECKGSVGFTKLTKENYIDILKNLMKNVPELGDQVGKKGYDYKYLLKVVQEYNTFMAENVVVNSDF